VIVLGLLTLALPVAAVAWLVWGRSHHTTDDGDERSLRRLLQYLFLLVALVSAASGVTRLVTAALPAGDRFVGPAPADVALGLSLTIVAVPLWLILWRAVRRRLARDADERSSTAWAVYVAVAATVTLVVALVNVIRVGTGVVTADTVAPGAVAAAVVWGPVWGLHAWFLERSPLAPAGPRRHLVALAGSAVGLVTLATGAVGVLSFGTGQAYRAIAGAALIEGWSTEAVRGSLVSATLGALVWWYHWLRHAITARRDTPWHLYVLLVGVLGGLLAATVSAGVTLYALLEWVISDPGTTAAIQFAATPRAVAVTAVGIWVWRYHATVLRLAGRERSEPDRAYEHLVAAVGLVTATSGVTIALAALIEALAPAPLAGDGVRGGDAVALALTLLLVGTPLWALFWRRLQNRVRTGPPVERRSPSRRTYVLVMFGVSGLTAAISAVATLFVVFRDLLEGRLAATVVNDMRFAIALVVAAGAVSAYHWAVRQEDRAAAPAQPPRRHVLLVSADGEETAAVLERRTGARVRTLHRLDVDAATVDTDAVTAVIMDSRHARLLVTVDADGTIHAIPYERT
jgi:Domain of unknown function (DUF5671)